MAFQNVLNDAGRPVPKTRTHEVECRFISMAVKTEPERSWVFYMKYVQIGEAFSALKSAFLIGLAFAIFNGGVWLVCTYGSRFLGLTSDRTSEMGEWIKSVVPEKVLRVLGDIGVVVFILFALREKDGRIEFPKLTVAGWVVVILWGSACLAAYAYLPFWLVFALYGFAMPFPTSIGTLLDIGKQRYDRENAGNVGQITELRDVE